MDRLAKNVFAAFIVLTVTASCLNSKQTNQTNNNSFLVNGSIINQQPDNLSDTFLNNLMAKYPQLFNDDLSKKDELRLQVIYTQIDRGKKEKNKTKFTNHTFNLNTANYFYPASTVKLPIAILVLQKLNELKIPGLNRNTTMITESAGGNQTVVKSDPSSADGRPTIAHYIKKILLVSDNDAFNRLYEFLGQEYINNTLHKMGYADAQIIHRLSVSFSDEENRLTNPVIFTDDVGRTIYTKPVEKSQLIYAERNIKMGKGYMKGTELVNEPFDFSKKNVLSLPDLHNIVRSIFFPNDVPKEQRFNLTKDDYDFLRRYMSMRPGESKSPVYAAPEYWDNYVKMFFYGTEKTKPEPDIRIFNKTGTAYGFLIESCYFADFKNNIEFLLSAVIYCNSDGVFNDDKYDYNTVGHPFFKNLGRVIYEYERTRVRKNKPELSPIFYNYTN